MRMDELPKGGNIPVSSISKSYILPFLASQRSIGVHDADFFESASSETLLP